MYEPPSPRQSLGLGIHDQSHIYRRPLPGVIERNPNPVIPKEHSVHEGVDDLSSESGVLHRTAPELLHPVDDEVPVHVGQGCLLPADGVLQAGAFCLQLHQQLLSGGSDDPGPDRLQDVLRLPLVLRELVPEAHQDGGVRLPLLESHDGIGHPLDNLRLKDVIQGSPDHLPLQPITGHVGLFASVIQPPLLADVVIMQLPNKYPIIKMDGVDISVEEMEAIEKLEGKQLRRLAFTLLCVAKYWDAVSEKNDHWVNTPDREIMQMANVSTSIKRQSAMFAELKAVGMIRFSRKIDNLNVRVVFMEDGETVLHIQDFRNLGYQYLKYYGGPYFECENCGLTVKIQEPARGRRQKYCPSCAIEVGVRQRVNWVMRERRAARQQALAET